MSTLQSTNAKTFFRPDLGTPLTRRPGETPSFKDVIKSQRLHTTATPANYQSRVLPERSNSQMLESFDSREYRPKPATEKDLKLRPTEEEARKLLENRFTASFEGPLQFDKYFRPINSISPTYLYGKGNLWNWGPNHAADALIVRKGENGSYQFLSIKRPDDTWALPGGFVDPKEHSRMAAIRELGEEAVENSAILQKKFETKAQPIFRGYVDDPRNTDNAWIETSVYLLTLTDREAKGLKLKARDDAKEVKWIDFTDPQAQNLYASHSDFINIAANHLRARSSRSRSPQQDSAIIVNSPDQLPLNLELPHIFLGGTIEMGNSRNWQAEVIDALKDLPVVILNPRRDDFKLPEDPQEAREYLKKQIQWELKALERADHIFINCESESLSPVTLMEIGLYGRSGKLSICCPEDFWRKTNVEVVSDLYGIPEQADLQQMIESARNYIENFKA